MGNCNPITVVAGFPSSQLSLLPNFRELPFPHHSTHLFNTRSVLQVNYHKTCIRSSQPLGLLFYMRWFPSEQGDLAGIWVGGGGLQASGAPAVEKQRLTQSKAQGLEPVTEMEDADSWVRTCFLRCVCRTQRTQLDTVTLALTNSSTGCQSIPPDCFDLYEHKLS